MEENQEKTDFKSIEEKSVFGCYSQNENKVTLALLKVLERAVGDDLLRKLIEEANGDDLPSPDIELTSQVTDTQEHSIPDGRIRCNYAFDYLIESKLSTQIPQKQLSEHLKTLESNPGSKLIYITTHSSRPKELLGLKNVLWINWTKVTNCLKSFIENDESSDPVLAYLVEQFCMLVKSIDIFDDGSERVIIVGGKEALPIAIKYHFYACQPYRSFKSAEYIAFLREGEISHLFKIEDVLGESIDLRDYPDVVSPEYFKDTDFFNGDEQYGGEPRKLFKLAEVVDVIKSPIVDNSMTKTGKHCAFVQRQAYTTLERIAAAKTTSDLRD